MGELKDKVKGMANEAIGEAKQKSGDADTRAEGAGQALIAIEWKGLRSKADFAEAQASTEPFLLSMGREDQRALAAA